MKLVELFPNDHVDENWRNAAFAGLLGTGLLSNPAIANQSMSSLASIASSPRAATQLQQVQPLTNNSAERVLIRAAVRQGIVGRELAQFMAQARHETENFTRLTERGGLRDFRKYDLQHNPARAQILENVRPGDGARYRGRGFLQVTGRYWYSLIGRELGINLESNPNLMADPEVAAATSIWFWKNQVRRRVTDPTDTITVTRRIHPGGRALSERQRFFNEYLASMR